MDKILSPAFTVYIFAHYNNEDPQPSSEIWAVDCEANELGFFSCLKEAITTNGQWEFKGYTIQRSETIFNKKPHKHFSSISHLLENAGGILVSWEQKET